MKRQKPQYRRQIGVALGLLGIAGLGVTLLPRHSTLAPPKANVSSSVPLPESVALTIWPWPRAERETLVGGVQLWHDNSSPDGTSLDLFDFDFGRDKRLRLEIFDQDQDDERPFDNRARFWERGVGQITWQLNATFRRGKQGHVLAVCNGLFFGPDRYSVGATAMHVAPVVLHGKPHYTATTHRWTFGVQSAQGRTVFKTLHLTDSKRLVREFDWASGGAQCLVQAGKPLTIQPVPPPGQPLPKGPAPSTPEDVGHIATVDHIKTSRVSFGWSRDNRHLYLLFVQEPDTETNSVIQFRHGLPMQGGWTLADLQRFWIAKGVWGAINSDGGDVAQLAYLQADGNYRLVSPKLSGGGARRVVSPNFENAPQGGSLMYWYIREKAK